MYSKNHKYRKDGIDKGQEGLHRKKQLKFGWTELHRWKNLKIKGDIYIYIYQDQTIEKFKHHKGYEFFSFTFVGLYIVLKDECWVFLLVGWLVGVFCLFVHFCFYFFESGFLCIAFTVLDSYTSGWAWSHRDLTASVSLSAGTKGVSHHAQLHLGFWDRTFLSYIPGPILVAFYTYKPMIEFNLWLWWSKR